MLRKRLPIVMFALLVGLVLTTSASAEVKYSSWKKTNLGNHYRRCTFPNGGYQYLFLFKAKPEWVYWYNPQKKVYWSCCPTKKHPDYKDEVLAQKDLFLIAIVKANDIEQCKFPEAKPGPGGSPSPNFKKGATAKDRDGSDVDLGCPPSDLPPGV